MNKEIKIYERQEGMNYLTFVPMIPEEGTFVIGERYGCMRECFPLEPVRVIFNDPATIVFWNDGTKTVVKCQDEPFDSEKGLAMAITKKTMGKKYGKIFKEFVNY